jgi:hypothetical protein
LINGISRTFRDGKLPAYQAARVIKRKNRGDVVEVPGLASNELGKA